MLFRSDGLTNTFLLGELHAPKGDTRQGPVWNGDDQWNYQRYAGHKGTQDPTTKRWTTEYRLISDTTYMGPGYTELFGSAHPSVCNFALCDGSIRGISNNIDFETYHRLSIREDGLTIGDY